MPSGLDGIDRPSAGQRRFRAFLAILLLNDGARAHRAEACDEFVADVHRAVAWWDLSDWERHDFSFVPQRDELIVLSDQPRHLAEAMSVRLAGPRPSGIPGLQLLDAHPDGAWFRFWHPPTRGLAQARSTRLPTVRPDVTATRLPGAEHTLPAAPQLADVERRALQVMSRTHPDVQHLLAAVLARLACSGRTGLTAAERSVRRWYSLWGTGLRWTLRGGSEVAAAELAAALTAPMTGLAEASISRYVDGVITVGCRRATLELIGKPV
ncbi:hypothetical protein [Kutzneria sp. CA-103260]|uniref:hypothetical protein n=1 Tax=Kutzneria sp. CA-103260 TaxID=2802641 RepID=UPI001BAAEC50|nr:hypothetical protein [Kutzneria sp. CA-103260]